MQPKISLPSSQDIVTCPYPEPDENIPHTALPLHYKINT
jgi:hypothetical protein